MSQRIKKFRTKEEAVANKNDDDRMFYDPFINEYYTISPQKYIWKQEEFEDNFIIIPETLEECIKLRTEHCQDCDFLPHREGNPRYCRRRGLLANREKMEIF